MKIDSNIKKISKNIFNKISYSKYLNIHFKKKIANNFSDIEKIYTTFYLSDTFKRGIYNFSEINYITYSGVTRKVEFHLVNLEIFNIKKNFSEIEKRLKWINIFYKLDRSTIININSIQILDSKKKQIIFKNKEYIYVNRFKLKELEKYYLENFNQPLLVL